MDQNAFPTVTIAEAKKIISATAHRQSILLLSAPGVGKSDAVRQAAVQRALRNTAWPEKKQTEENTNLFAPFLEVRELVVIFDYYRLLRKLEYVLSQALRQAVEKAERYGVDPCRFQPKL